MTGSGVVGTDFESDLIQKLKAARIRQKDGIQCRLRPHLKLSLQLHRAVYATSI